MNAHAQIVHQVPGRIRLSIAAMRGDDAYFRQLSERLATVEGVHRVRSNPTAGSVVLEFDGAADELMRRVGGDVLELDSGRSGALVTAMPLTPLQLVSGRELNPMFMAGVAFTAFGALQSLRGRVMVPALTAFWYAATTFQQASAQMDSVTSGPLENDTTIESES